MRKFIIFFVVGVMLIIISSIFINETVTEPLDGDLAAKKNPIGQSTDSVDFMTDKPKFPTNKLNMDSPGKGEALYVTLELNHNKLSLGHEVSVPKSTLKKQYRFVQYLAVIKDKQGRIVQTVPVKLDHLRAVLPQKGSGSSVTSCRCEEGEHYLSGDMRLEKFSAQPGSLSLFKLHQPYIESETSQSFSEFLQENELTLIDEVNL